MHCKADVASHFTHFILQRHLATSKPTTSQQWTHCYTYILRWVLVSLSINADGKKNPSWRQIIWERRFQMLRSVQIYFLTYTDFKTSPGVSMFLFNVCFIKFIKLKIKYRTYFKIDNIERRKTIWSIWSIWLDFVTLRKWKDQINLFGLSGPKTMSLMISIL